MDSSRRIQDASIKKSAKFAKEFFSPHFGRAIATRTTNFSHAGWSRTRCTTQLGHVHTGSSPNARSATHATMFWLDKRHGGQRGRRSVTAKAIDALCRQRGLCSPAMSRRARRSLAAMSLTTRGATSAMRRVRGRQLAAGPCAVAAPSVAGDHSLMSLPMCTRLHVSFAQQRGGRLAAFDKAVFASIYGAGGSLCLGRRQTQGRLSPRSRQIP